ncbi:LemA family protein [Selenomonadales bacterium OttesenSCG-928-I06]|nr:LemA family protein [Selenomonadales bacterium OttesenSCG-928-I06]
MTKKSTWIIVGVVVIAILGFFMAYNNLVSLNEDVTGKWSQVENQLQRRADLIPNLVNTVKGYAAHEQQAIQAVTEARTQLGGAKGPEAMAGANENLTSAISRLLVVVENYPDLKADANFRALMDELAGSENRIAIARRDYNNSVQIYNTKIKTLPTSLYAGMLGFGPREYFKVDEEAKKVPDVTF